MCTMTSMVSTKTLEPTESTHVWESIRRGVTPPLGSLASPRASNTKAKKQRTTTNRQSFADLVGVLSDVPELRGKTSVEVQHMLPALWNGKRS